jgi:metal-dependent HD superfamily phosphatase/phosphodiesterase
LRDILASLPLEERTVVISEALHAIISHSHGSAGKTSTVEGGIVRIADALDMSKGRSRIPYQMGQIDIHSVSANAIESVTVSEGEGKPVEIKIVMTTEAGVFQVDDFIEEKLEVSGLNKYIDVKSYLKENGKERIYKDYTS